MLNSNRSSQLMKVGMYSLVRLLDPIQGMRQTCIWSKWTRTEDGNELWSHTFGGPGMDLGMMVQSTADGGFILIGD